MESTRNRQKYLQRLFVCVFMVFCTLSVFVVQTPAASASTVKIYKSDIVTMSDASLWSQASVSVSLRSNSTALINYVAVAYSVPHIVCGGGIHFDLRVSVGSKDVYHADSSSLPRPKWGGPKADFTVTLYLPPADQRLSIPQGNTTVTVGAKETTAVNTFDGNPCSPQEALVVHEIKIPKSSTSSPSPQQPSPTATPQPTNTPTNQPAPTPIPASGTTQVPTPVPAPTPTPCTPVSGQVTVYEQANFTGRCQSFDVGQVSDLATYGLSGTTSSIKVPSNRTLFLFDQTGLGGQSGTFNQDVSDLSSGNWNDRARSLKIEPKLDTSCSVPNGANGVVLYRDVNYGTNGGCTLVTGNSTDLGSIGYTRFSSLQFVGSFVQAKRVTLYNDANYGTVCGVYTLNQSDLRNCAQIDIVSLKIEDYTPPQLANNVVSTAVLDHQGAGNAIDGNLDTEWVGGHQEPLGFVFAHPVTIQTVVVFDRKQNNPDNNQINNLQLVFSDGTVISNIDMTSGGPRCADVSFPKKQVSWVTVVPTDASGNNGFREVQVWDDKGSVSSQNNCVMKYSLTPQSGSGPSPLVSAPLSPPTVTETPAPNTPPVTQTPVPTPAATPAPTPTPAPQNTVFENFEGNTASWQMSSNVSVASATGNSYMRFEPTFTNPAHAERTWSGFDGYAAIRFRMNTHGQVLLLGRSQLTLTTNGISSVSLANYPPGGNKVDGWQDVTIPLSDFTGLSNNEPYLVRFTFESFDTQSTPIDIDDITFVR